MSIERTTIVPLDNVRTGLASSVNRPDEQQNPQRVEIAQSANIEFSEMSKLQNLAQADAATDINQERLERVRLAMEKGELHIDAEKIARSLVQDMLNQY